MACGNYCVVEFIDSKDLATVPSSWISEELCSLACAWPSGKHPRKFAKMDAPVDISWTKYPCEILHTFDTYEAAIKKERFLESFSDLEVSVELQPGSVKKRRKNYSSSEDESEDSLDHFPIIAEVCGYTGAVALPDVSSSMNLCDQELNSHEAIPDVDLSDVCKSTAKTKRSAKPFSNHIELLGSSHRLKAKHRKRFSSKNKEESPGPPPPPVIIEVAGSTGAVALPDVSSSINFIHQEEVDSCEVSSDVDFSKRLERLEKCCAVIQKDVRQILDILRSESSSQVTSIEKLDVIENYLPLTNLPALYELESQLADSLERREELRVHLQQLGGSSVDEMVKKMLRHIFTDDLAQHFSWFGQKGKNKLCDLFLMKCIFQAVGSSKIKWTRERIENRIKEWFRQASTRNKHLIERQCRVFYT